MSELTDINYVKAIMAENGINFSKALGQNFLVNPTVCPRMAAESGAREGTGVLEIGPGAGVLTAELAETGAKVVAVEIDKGLIPVLKKTLAGYNNIKIINGDILKLNVAELLKEEFGDMPVSVCANLPYYITSQVIMLLLESHLPLTSITVMVQKEAAQRLCAKVGSRMSGAVTVAAEYYAEREQLFDVSSGSFVPRPKVDSRVIRLTPRKTPPVSNINKKLFFKIVKAGFGQRRKTLLNALSAGMSIEKSIVAAAISTAGLPESVRMEQLTMENIAALSREIPV